MIPIHWTSNIANDLEAKEAFEVQLRNSSKVLDRLKEILKEKEGELDKAELSLSSYQQEGWPYLQAFLNGRRAILREINKLVTIE